LAWAGAATVSIDGLAISTVAGVQAVRAGSVVVFDAPIEGARHWVAARGGFVAGPPALLKRGDRLYLGESLPLQILHPPELDDMSPSGSQLRAMPGRPEFRQLFKNRYVVRHDSDRAGIRLEGPRMAHDLELPSEPATPGVVQITPDGFPIILGPDGPTIGGYPRAAVVISADVSVLAQLRPGAEVCFAPAGTNLNK
jgi:allophanate hydrolase subunit 2